MSNRKSKSSQNNENLCPLARKRIKSSGSTNKTTSHSPRRTSKVETASSPSELTIEYLKEMGIGILDSEESSCSSSAASAIALAVNASTDENSNEVTPYLEAPAFRHQRMAYRSVDTTLDRTVDNISNIYNDDDNNSDTLKAATTDNSNNNNSPETAINDTQQKKVAILGAGAGLNAAQNAHSTAKNTRSPLAMVYCNRNECQPKAQQGATAITPTSSLNNNVYTISAQSSSGSQQSHSPSLPSTSRQAALMKQQHLQVQRKQQPQSKQAKTKEQPNNSPLPLTPDENFFLFRNSKSTNNCTANEKKDYFSLLSDEIILQIFKWMPKKTLIRCSYVCRRFNRCAADESLWTRLDLGGRTLRAGALENVLIRGVVIFRLAQAQLKHPVFNTNFIQTEPKFESKLQYLDLSMVAVTKPSLRMLMSCCLQLKKLSLEHVPLNDDICNEIAKNTNLETLNLAMCTGIEAWSVRKLMESLQNLNSLNISWTVLSADAVTSLVTNITPNLMRLNVAGCRKTMFDSHLATLCRRCPNLLELDLSDCTGLTGDAIGIICKFKMLEYLSLSRCYLIPAASYIKLKELPTLTYLDIFGILSDSAMEMLERYFPSIGINKFIHSSVARPTVGTRRTSIWGLRTRD